MSRKFVNDENWCYIFTMLFTFFLSSDRSALLTKSNGNGVNDNVLVVLGHILRNQHTILELFRYFSPRLSVVNKTA